MQGPAKRAATGEKVGGGLNLALFKQVDPAGESSRTKLKLIPPVFIVVVGNNLCRVCDSHIVYDSHIALDPRPPIVLLEVGSFSPITNMHLRLLEQARDAASENYQVLGGIISPVSDGYEKKGLASASHRLQMARLATHGSTWIQVDDWEALQADYQPTVNVLEHFSKVLPTNTQLFLACGADLLASLQNERAWTAAEIHSIFSSLGGMFVLERQGVEIQQIIFGADLLYKYRQQIFPIHQYTQNSISSTTIRRCIARGLSIKYLVDDAVVDYIQEHSLYADTLLERKVSIFGGD